MRPDDVPAVFGNMLIGDGSIDHRSLLAPCFIEIGRFKFEVRFAIELRAKFADETETRPGFDINGKRGIRAFRDRPEKRL